MSTITTKDGTQIYYKDWGRGPVVTFSHGWPLSSDAWDGQMLFLAQKRLPRGCARPPWPWPVQPGLIRERHERLCRRSCGCDRGARSQGRHAGGPLHLEILSPGDVRGSGRRTHHESGTEGRDQYGPKLDHDRSAQGSSPQLSARDFHQFFRGGSTAARAT